MPPHYSNIYIDWISSTPSQRGNAEKAQSSSDSLTLCEHLAEYIGNPT